MAVKPFRKSQITRVVRAVEGSVNESTRESEDLGEEDLDPDPQFRASQPDVLVARTTVRSPENVLCSTWITTL